MGLLNGRHQVALWAGIFSFFGSLLAFGIFDLVTPEAWFEYLGAFLVSFITGGSVYAKQRWEDAKKEEETTRKG